MDIRARLSVGACVVAAAMAATFSVQAETFTQDEVAKGLSVYNRACVHCHGRNMVNSGNTVYDLRRFPQDDKPRYMEAVINGKGNMPSWKDRLTHAEIQATWAYVATRGGKEM